jgi:predicted nucleic acid-binding protein
VPSLAPSARLPGAPPVRQPVGVIDTSAILALVDRNDAWHEPCVHAYNHHRLPWLTSEAALTEAFHLLIRRDFRDDRPIWTLLHSGAIIMSTIANEELPVIDALMAQYADRPMDFADATLVHLAARERLTLILTIDHDDFSTYRLPRRKKFTILPRRGRS